MPRVQNKRIIQVKDPVDCPVCCFTIKSADNLKRHLMTRHQDALQYIINEKTWFKSSFSPGQKRPVEFTVSTHNLKLCALQLCRSICFEGFSFPENIINSFKYRYTLDKFSDESKLKSSLKRNINTHSDKDLNSLKPKIISTSQCIGVKVNMDPHPVADSQLLQSKKQH